MYSLNKHRFRESVWTHVYLCILVCSPSYWKHNCRLHRLRLKTFMLMLFIGRKRNVLNYVFSYLCDTLLSVFFLHSYQSAPPPVSPFAIQTEQFKSQKIPNFLSEFIFIIRWYQTYTQHSSLIQHISQSKWNNTRK